MIPEGIKVIGFDADDTLWENETFFREAELEFAHLMKEYDSKENILKIPNPSRNYFF